MKTIIFILLFPLFAEAQRPEASKPSDRLRDKTNSPSLDSLLKMMRDSGIATMTLGQPLGMEIPKYKQDTVRCIMLVSDTATIQDSISFFWLNYQCTWKYGFQTEIYGSGANIYLDSDKKRLPKNIIVWATKEY